MSGKTSELIALLADGRSRSVPEIHAVIGPCRLNSRAAEARKRLRAQGRDLVCSRTPGVSGPEAYVYRIVDGPLTERETSVGDEPGEATSHVPVSSRADDVTSRSVSDSLTRSGPDPQSSEGFALSGSGAFRGRPSGSEQLSLDVAA